jgi:hypothetical protein
MGKKSYLVVQVTKYGNLCQNCFVTHSYHNINIMNYYFLFSDTQSMKSITQDSFNKLNIMALTTAHSELSFHKKIQHSKGAQSEIKISYHKQ